MSVTPRRLSRWESAELLVMLHQTRMWCRPLWNLVIRRHSPLYITTLYTTTLYIVLSLSATSSLDSHSVVYPVEPTTGVLPISWAGLLDPLREIEPVGGIRPPLTLREVTLISSRHCMTFGARTRVAHPGNNNEGPAIQLIYIHQVISYFQLQPIPPSYPVKISRRKHKNKK